MTAVEAIAIAIPTAVAQGIFSCRRFNSGIDSISDNPLYGGLNLDIAASQVVKGTRAVADIKPVGEALKGASETIKNTTLSTDVAKDVSAVSKAVNGFGKGVKTVLNFTAANINPIICISSLAKVIYGDEEDKVKAGLQEGVSIATMFGFEDAYKAITGMPKISYKNGKQISTDVKGLYKEIPVVAKCVEKFAEKCNTTKLFNTISMKSAPPVLKGTGFALASIAGYKTGNAIAHAGENTTSAAA